MAVRVIGTEFGQVSLLAAAHHGLGRAEPAGGTIGTGCSVEDSLSALAANSGITLAVADAVRDQRVAHLQPVRSGSVGSYLGVPLILDGGRALGTLCVFNSYPSNWSEADVALLEQLADSAMAQLELFAQAGEYEAGRARWELSIDAAGIGSFDWDLVNNRLEWDDRLLELFGLDQGDFDGQFASFRARIHPLDRARSSRAVAEAVERVGVYETEYRVVLPSGRLRWVQARGRVLGDETGKAVRMLGTAVDATDLREGEAQIVRLLESMPAAFLSVDRTWRVSYANTEAQQLLGIPVKRLVGGILWELFPQIVGSQAEACYRRAMDSSEPATFESRHPASGDTHVEVRAWPTSDGLSLYLLDITARHVAAQQAMRESARSALLSLVSTELTGTLDAREAAALLSRLVVPALADWCIVSLVEDETNTVPWRSLVDVGCWNADPEKLRATQSYANLRLRALTETSFLTGALLSGERTDVLDNATEAILARILPGEAADLLTLLNPKSSVVLPLRAHGRTRGLLTLFCDQGSTHFAEGELDIAGEVAVRAGLALDNARLYDQQRALAEALQRSLLTEPTQPPDGRIAVRYTPAAEVAQVGGDWYDSFLQADGETVLVIGDVLGHDSAAAASMGQLRSLLRGIAATTGEGPAAVLSRLDGAMDLLEVRTTATAIVARLDQSAQRGAGRRTKLCWSNAGHPPPMKIDPDGSVVVLGGSDREPADLLLGVDPTTTRTACEVDLAPGATVLLYTDGLLEQRGQSLSDGLVRLRTVLVELAPLALEDLCDALLERMLADRPEDDVALIAIRLNA